MCAPSVVWQVRRIQELEAMLREREEEDDRRRHEAAHPTVTLPPANIIHNAFAGVVASAGGVAVLDPRLKLADDDDDDGFDDDDDSGAASASRDGKRGDNGVDDESKLGDAPAPRKSVRFASPTDDDDDAIMSPTSTMQFDGILTRLSGHRHSNSAPAFVAESTSGSDDGSGLLIDTGGGVDSDGAAGSGAVPVDGEVTSAVARAEADFEKRQLAMERNIRDYERTIVLKEDRLRALQVRRLWCVFGRVWRVGCVGGGVCTTRVCCCTNCCCVQAKQGEMESMQRYYEEKLAQMQASIVELTQQRDRLQSEMQVAEANKHTSGGLAAHTDLAERLESTERQLTDMKGRHRDLARIADVKAKMAAEVCGMACCCCSCYC